LNRACALQPLQLLDLVGNAEADDVARLFARLLGSLGIAPRSSLRRSPCGTGSCWCQRGFGGAEGDRTPDLRIANATLSQLSYGPDRASDPFDAQEIDYGRRAAACQARLRQYGR
jgi:hypothetical protein